MSEMIERVARAISNAHYDNQMQHNGGGTSEDDDRILARAAIEAMRNPPEAVTEAMFREMGSPSDGGYCDEAWAAAIKEILK